MEKHPALTLASCLMMFFVFAGNSAVTPALSAMRAELWSDIPASTVSLVSTLPSLTAILGCLFAGAVAGRYLSWKGAVALAFAIYIGFGTLPAVVGMTDFHGVLAMRAAFGFGMGMLIPMGNALVIRIYKGKSQDKVLGWAQACQSAGGIAMQIAGGLLASIGPQYAYGAYFIAAIGLAVALVGLPDFPLERRTRKGKEKIPHSCYGFLILLFLGIMSMTPAIINCSVLMSERGFGDAALAGIVSSFYTVGGVAAGFAFGPAFGKVGKWLIPFGYTGCALACLLVVLSGDVFMLMLALFLASFFFVQVRPSIYKIVGTSVSPAQSAAVIGAAAAIYNLGNFMATYYMKAVDALFFGGAEGPDHAIIVSVGMFIAMAAVSGWRLKRG